MLSFPSNLCAGGLPSAPAILAGLLTFLPRAVQEPGVLLPSPRDSKAQGCPLMISAQGTPDLTAIRLAEAALARV